MTKGKTAEKKKNIRAGWKGFEHSQGAGDSPGRQTLGRRVVKNAYFLALTDAAHM